MPREQSCGTFRFDHAANLPETNVMISETVVPKTAAPPTRTEIESLYDQYVAPLANRGLTITRGQGRYAWDDQGQSGTWISAAASR